MFRVSVPLSIIRSVRYVSRARYRRGDLLIFGCRVIEAMTQMATEVVNNPVFKLLCLRNRWNVISHTAYIAIIQAGKYMPVIVAPGISAIMVAVDDRMLYSPFVILHIKTRDIPVADNSSTINPPAIMNGRRIAVSMFDKMNSTGIVWK